jgi:hypothetical protein
MMKRQPADHVGHATTLTRGRRVFSGTSRWEAPPKVETLFGDRPVRDTEEGFGDMTLIPAMLGRNNGGAIRTRLAQ